jgi:hypothetical protein
MQTGILDDANPLPTSDSKVENDHGILIQQGKASKKVHCIFIRQMLLPCIFI